MCVVQALNAPPGAARAAPSPTRKRCRSSSNYLQLLLLLPLLLLLRNKKLMEDERRGILSDRFLHPEWGAAWGSLLAAGEEGAPGAPRHRCRRRRTGMHARRQRTGWVACARVRACVHSPMHAFACTLPHPRRYITCVHAQAAQRQQQFEQSAVGRAAYTSVKDAKKPQAPVVRGGGAGGLNAGNWN